MIQKIKENQTVQKLFICFWMYAVLGWLYEVFLEVVVYRWGFHNRGDLFGPYCPIYGVGAMLFLLFFSKLMKKKEPKWLVYVKPLLVFLGCMTVATTVELAATYILEYTKGSWPWQTYANYKYNFQARIALSTSVRFGLGGLLFMYVVQPFFDWLLSKPKRRTINIIAIAVLLIVLTDFIYVNTTGYKPKLAEVQSALQTLLFIWF
jgi:uncharacterized membrane protein